MLVRNTIGPMEANASTDNFHEVCKHMTRPPTSVSEELTHVLMMVFQGLTIPETSFVNRLVNCPVICPSKNLPMSCFKMELNNMLRTRAAILLPAMEMVLY